MKDKLLKQLINKCIEDCNREIDNINNNSNKSNLNYKRKLVKRIKNNINNITLLKDEEIKELLNDLEYEDFNERLSIENNLLDIKNSILNKIKINDYQYKVIYNFYSMIDNYEEYINKDNIKALDTLNELLNKFNDLYNDIFIDNKYIEDMDTLNLVFKYNHVSFNDKVNLLSNIMKYNEGLFKSE